MNERLMQTISCKMALESGHFFWDSDKLRPSKNSGLAELLGHRKDHNTQGFILPANKPGKDALLMGGSKHTLSELSEALKIPIDRYKPHSRPDKPLGQVQHNNKIKPNTSGIYKYWKEHNIKNPKTILDSLNITTSKMNSQSKYKGHNCFVIPLMNGSFKYFILDNSNKVIDKRANQGGKNTLFPDYSHDTFEDVFIVESISDVINLRELGYNAFCYSGGVGELYKISWFIKQRLCYYIPQANDKPAKVYFEKICYKLSESGNHVRVIHLPTKDKETKLDVCDYFSDHEKEDFQKLIETASTPSILRNKMLFNVLLEHGTFINTTVGNNPLRNNNYFALAKKKLIKIFKGNDGEINSHFKNIINENILPKINSKLIAENKRIKENPYLNSKDKKEFETFNLKKAIDIIHNALLVNPHFLKLKHCEVSNLSVLDKENNELVLSTALHRKILITHDFEFAYYGGLTPKEDKEIEKTFDQLYRDNSKVIQAHIISAIINETFGSKHLFFIYGSSNIGKSKTAELISRIITNDYKSMDITKLDSLWKNFFLTRSPVLDNIDIVKNLDGIIASDLSELITASKVTKNVRYTVSGLEFPCDVYPVITTINGDLLDRADMQTLKTRSIMIEITYNPYAKNNIDKLFNNTKFIENARLHFYYKAMQYLKDTEEFNFDHRAKNFFNVLYWLDKDYASEYHENLKELKVYPAIVADFIRMLDHNEVKIDGEDQRTIDDKEPTYLLDQYYTVKEWVEFFHEFTKEKYKDKVTEKTLFRYKLSKFIISDTLDRYLLDKKRSNKGNSFKFTLLENTNSESD